MPAPRVLIVGGGFGGLTVAQRLARAPVHVMLVDRQNHHLFQPLLYQVASAAVSSVEIAAPLRHVLGKQRNATVVLGEVESIDLAKRTATLAPMVEEAMAEEGGGAGDARPDAPTSRRRTIEYDWLVLAPGAVDDYFGNEAWRPDAPGLKTLDEALEIRSRILLAFERAENEDDAARRSAWITFVIVGAGPTGVGSPERSSRLAVDAIVRDFRQVDTAATRVVLIEAGERLLPAMHPDSSASALRGSEGLGVEVRRRVVGVDGGRVSLQGGESIAAHGALGRGCARGALLATLGVPLARGGRIAVRPDLSLAEHPEVFVIGDAAACTDPRGRAVPGVAPAAMQMGRHVAAVIAREVRAAPRGDATGRGPVVTGAATAAPARPPFRYVDKGTMATIGRSRAVAELGGRHFGGLVAWLLWLFVHLIFLVGFRNRIVVLISWAQSYLFFRAGARVITQTRRET
ncbi:MAG: NAD(P)/FAD-dependent oxidoreductase [Phycisphaerales bacterium]